VRSAHSKVRVVASPESGREHLPPGVTEAMIVEQLRADGHRVTEPRRLIIRCLIEAHDHRTADDLARAVQAINPEVALSTIYRNLEELERLKIVEHAHVGHGAVSYHLAAGTHAHAVCESCGATIEVPERLFGPLLEFAETTHGFAIDPHHIALVGRCAACRRSAATGPGGATGQR
jgi:Fur family transcriptional regulator, ferric uptake regulator